MKVSRSEPIGSLQMHLEVSGETSHEMEANEEEEEDLDEWDNDDPEEIYFGS